MAGACSLYRDHLRGFALKDKAAPRQGARAFPHSRHAYHLYVG